MYVLDCDEDGSGSGELESNWRLLRSEFLGIPGMGVFLTRRENDGSLVFATWGVFAGGLEFENIGESARRFTVDLFLPDPWFYLPSETLGVYSVGTTDITGDIVGDVRSHRFTLRFDGPLTNPSVTVRAATDWGGTVDLSTVAYSGTIASGKHLEVTWPDYAVDASAGITVLNVTAPRVPWVCLDPRATSIVVGGSGGGTVTVTYFSAWA